MDWKLCACACSATAVLWVRRPCLGKIFDHPEKLAYVPNLIPMIPTTLQYYSLPGRWAAPQ
eukprot:scaffold44039_cov161-Skeletonema_marinoi.AAC.5